MHPLKPLLAKASIEVLSSDKRTLSQLEALPSGTEVFIAHLPNESINRLIEAAVAIRATGLEPVPHLVARNLEGPPALQGLINRLITEAGVNRALVLGGDRPLSPACYRDAMQLITSDILGNAGLQKAFIGAYPEGHPTIPADTLWASLGEKLAACQQRGMEVELVSQFCFDPAAILQWAQQLRALEIQAPYRVGVAGLTSRMRLLRYAMRCGVGPSLRMLSGREGLIQNMLATETPENLLLGLKDQAQRLGISSAHLFTFGDIGSTVNWLKEKTGAS